MRQWLQAVFERAHTNSPTDNAITAAEGITSATQALSAAAEAISSAQVGGTTLQGQPPVPWRPPLRPPSRSLYEVLVASLSSDSPESFSSGVSQQEASCSVRRRNA